MLIQYLLQTTWWLQVTLSIIPLAINWRTRIGIVWNCTQAKRIHLVLHIGWKMKWYFMYSYTGMIVLKHVGSFNMKYNFSKYLSTLNIHIEHLDWHDFLGTTHKLWHYIAWSPFEKFIYIYIKIIETVDSTRLVQICH